MPLEISDFRTRTAQPFTRISSSRVRELNRNLSVSQGRLFIKSVFRFQRREENQPMVSCELSGFLVLSSSDLAFIISNISQIYSNPMKIIWSKSEKKLGRSSFHDFTHFKRMAIDDFNERVEHPWPMARDNPGWTLVFHLLRPENHKENQRGRRSDDWLIVCSCTGYFFHECANIRSRDLGPAFMTPKQWFVFKSGQPSIWKTLKGSSLVIEFQGWARIFLCGFANTFDGSWSERRARLENFGYWEEAWRYRNVL